MARPRKPTRILELTGAFRKNPQRRKQREAEPQPPAGLGAAPADLSDAERTCWERIAAEAPEGVLTSADRSYVRSAAILMALEDAREINTKDRGQLHKLLADFGMSPRGRSYIKVAPDSGRKANEFADI